MAKKFKADVMGVHVEVDERALTDVRFTFAIGKATDKKVKDEQKLVWYSRMMELLFGEDGAYDAMCGLAEANDGYVSVDVYNNFFSEVLEAVGAKN